MRGGKAENLEKVRCSKNVKVGSEAPPFSTETVAPKIV